MTLHPASVPPTRRYRPTQRSRPVLYDGEYACVDFYPDQAPESDGGPQRLVYVFRLTPLEGQSTDSARTRRVSVAASTTVESVAIEQHLTEKAFVDPSGETYEAERREAGLVQDYAAHLRRSVGHRVSRLRILPAGEAKPLFTDLFDETSNLLIEAKDTVTREAMRMAIGQLLDYRRFIPTPHLAVLVPTEPRHDLMDLLGAAHVAVVYPGASGDFVTVAVPAA